MFVVTFIVGNKTFFICIKTRHGFIHCSASQRVLVAATISQQKSYRGSLERITSYTVHEAPTCTLKPNNRFCILSADEVC